MVRLLKDIIKMRNDIDQSSGMSQKIQTNLEALKIASIVYNFPFPHFINIKRDACISSNFEYENRPMGLTTECVFK